MIFATQNMLALASSNSVVLSVFLPIKTMVGNIVFLFSSSKLLCFDVRPHYF
jgi:hypothetical protein